ncbi:hypothetical protein CFOL_v3_16328, partial [Cephalotus follicularis]
TIIVSFGSSIYLSSRELSFSFFPSLLTVKEKTFFAFVRKCFTFLNNMLTSPSDYDFENEVHKRCSHLPPLRLLAAHHSLSLHLKFLFPLFFYFSLSISHICLMIQDY